MAVTPIPLGTSIVLIAVGAILRYAVTEALPGIKLDVVGLILIIVGILGLILSVLYMAFASDRDRAERPVDEEITRRRR